LERNESFALENVNDLAIRMAWAQVEIFADDIQRVQVLAAGDENSVKELRIQLEDDTLVVEQPQYGLSINITESHWMQVCVRVPNNWAKKIHVNTINGLLNARGLIGSRIVLDTVTGDVHASRMSAPEIVLKSVSGDIHAEDLNADQLTVRSVSGTVALEGVTAKSYKCTNVSGKQKIVQKAGFEHMELRAVSGDVTLVTPVERLAVTMRSLSGRVATEGVQITKDTGVPTVQATGVSAELKLILAKG